MNLSIHFSSIMFNIVLFESNDFYELDSKKYIFKNYSCISKELNLRILDAIFFDMYK